MVREARLNNSEAVHKMKKWGTKIVLVVFLACLSRAQLQSSAFPPIPPPQHVPVDWVSEHQMGALGDWSLEHYYLKTSYTSSSRSHTLLAEGLIH